MDIENLIVITGPAAVGKTETVKRLLDLFPEARKIRTTTTRAPRDGEVDGVDYNFVSLNQFKEDEDTGKFIEVAENYGNLYGTPRRTIKEMISKHPIVFCVLDIKGARAVKSDMPGSIVIFITPGSMDDIQRRLEDRDDTGTENKEQRIDEASYEINKAREFDCVIKNIEGEFENTIERIKNVIKSHILRI